MRGRMFKFAIFADSRGLAIAFHAGGGNSQSRDRPLGEQFAEFFADQHQL